MPEVLNPETGELTEVDEDAIAAEMTPDDGDPAPDPEPDPEPQEPPAPSGPSQQDMEKGFKTVERAAKAYAEKVGTAFPDGVLDLQTCPLCADLVPAFVDMNLAGAVAEEAKAATLAYLGFAREQDYEPATNIEACRICKGKGMVKTGSLVPENATKRCDNCRGYGYYPPPTGGPAAIGAPEARHAPVDEITQPLDSPDVDVTGEPRILPNGVPNPNFGLWPQYKVQVPPYGTTAGLTAQDVTP